MIDVDLARAQFAKLQDAAALLAQTLTRDVMKLRPGQPIQAALDLGVPVIVLEPGTYDGAITCRNPVTIMPSVDVPAGCRAAGFEPVVITSSGDTVRVVGSGVSFTGLSVKSTSSSNQLVTVVKGTQNTLLDRLLLMGDPTRGQHRGVEANGGHISILGCRIDQCWLPDRDAQAICGWNGTANLLISDCYLSGGAETVMFGGADSASHDDMPHDIIIRRSALTKDPRWYSMPGGCFIKNCFELKAARNVTMQDCDLSYAGTSGGQSGYLIVLTPRNQGGKAPWSAVTDVTIQRCKGANCGGGINMMGSDNLQPSGPLSNVNISGLTIENIDPLSAVMFPGTSKGAGRGLLWQRAPDRITLEHIALTGNNLGAGAYFIGPPPTASVMRDITCTPSKFGWKIDAGGQGQAAVQAWAPGLTIDNCHI